MLATLRAKRLLWPTVMTGFALPVLIGLGSWQMQRKAWKETLIAAIAERTTAAPVELVSATSATYEDFNLGFEYMRVKARGRFLNDKERYYYAPEQARGPGYHVYTPFELKDGGAIVFVNRGFVPEALKLPETRAAGQAAGEVEVVGLLRAPASKPAMFTPENDVAKNLWYWRDYDGMFKSAFGASDRAKIPVFLDAEGEAQGGWPKGGVTRVDLPNRHLEYALTWYGLAAALAAVFAVFAAGRLRER